MFKKNNTIFKVATLIAMAAFLMACGHKKDSKSKQGVQKIITVKAAPSVSHLYYKGTLAPLHITPVLSVVDGRVRKISFKYGDTVTKNQALVEMRSDKLTDDYRTAVTNFLKAKEAYENAKESYAGNKLLYKAGLYSEEQYSGYVSTYRDAVLAFYQSKVALEKVLKTIGITYSKIETLTLANMQQVNVILSKKLDKIEVSAPISGVALFPPTSGSSSGSGDGSSCSGQLTVGCSLKSGELILNVGDLNGLSTKVQVSEININRIKVGQKAVITGNAYPGLQLNGMVSSVAAQAESAGADSSASGGVFDVLVKIPTVTKKQLQVIKVGMSANIDILIQNPPQIMVPIQAVEEKNAKSYVTVVNGSGQKKSVAVVTGHTTIDQVVIVKGLKTGDRVLVSSQQND